MNTTVEAVLLRLRRDLLDTVEPYLWLDEELIDYISEKIAALLTTERAAKAVNQ